MARFAPLVFLLGVACTSQPTRDDDGRDRTAPSQTPTEKVAREDDQSAARRQAQALAGTTVKAQRSVVVLNANVEEEGRAFF